MPKPKPAAYPRELKTFGDHIRRRRLDLNLLQSDAAKIMGISEATVSNWEIGDKLPQIQFYPRVIEFLGYLPFEVDTSTLAGRIKYYRFVNGLSHVKMGAIIGVDSSTICRWELGELLHTRKDLNQLQQLIGVD